MIQTESAITDTGKETSVNFWLLSPSVKKRMDDVQEIPWKD